MADRYGGDVLAGDWRAPRAGRALPLAAETGLVVEDAQTGWCGAVVRVEKAGGMHVVHLQDRRGRTKGFPLGPGFLHEGRPVVLSAPAAARRGAAGAARERTASGSRAVPGTTARVARGSRIFVEGRHDAEFVEKVWGEDLRIEGVVVEYLQGVDDLAAVITEFAPTDRRRLGILVDHLVPGSKESRIVDQARALTPWSTHVLIVGHPFVDIWQAVRPERLGLAAWPHVPRGVPWKQGVLAHLGWPHDSQADVAGGWRRILAGVRTYADVEPALLGRVEELIDFVTVGFSG